MNDSQQYGQSSCLPILVLEEYGDEKKDRNPQKVAEDLIIEVNNELQLAQQMSSLDYYICPLITQASMLLFNV